MYLQEEINHKTVALSVKTVKLTATVLKDIIKKFLEHQKNKSAEVTHGKQSIKELSKQNAGLSTIEITDSNIKAFEQTAKKYGVDFALKKDATETPPKYIVFFKGRDADAITSAFKEFAHKRVKQQDKPSLRKALEAMKEAAKALNPLDKVKNKDRGLEL